MDTEEQQYLGCLLHNNKRKFPWKPLFKSINIIYHDMTHVPCPLPPQQVGCPIQGDLRTAKSFDYEHFIYDSSLLYLENVWSLQMKTAGYWSLGHRRGNTQHWVSRIREGIKIFFSNVEEENFTEIKWSSFVPYQLPHQPIYFWSWMRESPFAAKS